MDRGSWREALFGRWPPAEAIPMTDPEFILTAARRARAQQAEVFTVQTEETPVRFEAIGVE